jgi:diketogulonate reductase-like aldo/keto reductase
MVQSLEASLERLGTDYLDLFWVHAWDALTPVEDVMRGWPAFLPIPVISATAWRYSCALPHSSMIHLLRRRP